jgi:hypothetical protein
MIIAITDQEIQTHMREFFSQVSLRILVTGNMYKDVSAQLLALKLGLSLIYLYRKLYSWPK